MQPYFKPLALLAWSQSSPCPRAQRHSAACNNGRDALPARMKNHCPAARARLHGGQPGWIPPPPPKP